MSRVRSLFGSKGRFVVLASIVCVAALAMSGCVTAKHLLGRDFLTLSKSTTDPVMLAYYGPACNQDLDGDGVPGLYHDRALCAFYVIRGSCNQADDYTKVICYAVTDPKYWREFLNAPYEWSKYHDTCIYAVRESSVSGPVVRWAGETAGGDCSTK